MPAVIFDLDGTLVESTELHADTFVDAFREFGYDVEREKVKELIGISGIEIVERITGKPRQEIFKRKVELFLERIHELKERKNASRVLKQLRKRGIKVGLATSSTREMTEAIVEKFGWKFDCIVTPENVERGKPDPQMLAMAVEKLGGPAVYVGDTEYDRKMAELCGVDPLILGENLGDLGEVLSYRFGRVRTHELADREMVGTPVKVAPGYARVVLLTKEIMKVDESGLVNDSFTFGVAELAAMLAVNRPGVLLKSAMVRFLRKVHVGDVIVGEGWFEKGRVRVRAIVKGKAVLEGLLEVHVG